MSARRVAIAAALALCILLFGLARRYQPDELPFVPTQDDEVLERLPVGVDEAGDQGAPAAR